MQHPTLSPPPLASHPPAQAIMWNWGLGTPDQRFIIGQTDAYLWWLSTNVSGES